MTRARRGLQASRRSGAGNVPAAPYWLGGRRTARAALVSGRVHRLLIAASARPDPELLAAGKARGIEAERVQPGIVERLAGPEAHGVAALVDPLAAGEIEEVLAGDRAEDRLLLACDHLQDPRNLGSLARTAEAAGAAGIILPLRRGTQVTPAAERTAAGALESLPVVAVHNVVAALQACKRAGFWVYGAAPDGERVHPAVDWAPRAVIVIGAEGAGLAPLVRRHCDVTVSLPMLGRVESLNASVAGGILMYGWAAARREARSGMTGRVGD